MGRSSTIWTWQWHVPGVLNRIQSSSHFGEVLIILYNGFHHVIGEVHINSPSSDPPFLLHFDPLSNLKIWESIRTTSSKLDFLACRSTQMQTVEDTKAKDDPYPDRLTPLTTNGLQIQFTRTAAHFEGYSSSEQLVQALSQICSNLEVTVPTGCTKYSISEEHLPILRSFNCKQHCICS